MTIYYSGNVVIEVGSDLEIHRPSNNNNHDSVSFGTYKLEELRFCGLTLAIVERWSDRSSDTGDKNKRSATEIG